MAQPARVFAHQEAQAATHQHKDGPRVINLGLKPFAHAQEQPFDEHQPKIRGQILVVQVFPGAFARPSEELKEVRIDGYEGRESKGQAPAERSPSSARQQDRVGDEKKGSQQGAVDANTQQEEQSGGINPKTCARCRAVKKTA